MAGRALLRDADPRMAELVDAQPRLNPDHLFDGLPIGAVMFLVIGNPASGGSSAPELLPGFWRALSQLLPPGAATTAMRDVVYFHGHGMTPALLVLGAWAILGAIVAVTVNTLRGRARPATASS